MIKFMYEEVSQQLTFDDVEDSQFFILDKILYQKCGTHYANRLADTDGTPQSGSGLRFLGTAIIDRILPRVIIIEVSE